MFREKMAEVPMTFAIVMRLRCRLEIYEKWNSPKANGKSAEREVPAQREVGD